MTEDRSKAYAEAGVDIRAADQFIAKIKSLVSSTFSKSVITDIGGFSGLFKLNLSSMEAPVLVASTDGVGTKLKLAFAYDRHDTIGIDLVAMSVNDILVQGAEPLFFLDYFATGKLDVGVAEQVLAGIVEGCKQAGCSLLGGETAEMPDFYAPGEYDLSGFCVGIVDNSKIVDGSGIRVGDKIIGLSSSGLHSNGFSLVRKLAGEHNLLPEDAFPGSRRTVAEVLLEPTKIYVRPVLRILRDLTVKAMVHVTGGGFYDNIPRVLPHGVCAQINFNSWSMQPVFNWIKDAAGITWPEMLQIFNCGIGYIMVVPEDEAEDVLNRLRGLNEVAWLIGEIRRPAKSETELVCVEFTDFEEETSA